MDTSSNPFPQLKLLAAQAKDARFTILLTGSTTVYTSSMTNPLSSTRIKHIDIGKQGLLEIVIWECTINGLPCRIITMPELGNISYDTALIQPYIQAIKNCISPIHCIWFVARLYETGLRNDEKNVIKWITTILDESAWNYAILVLTHSNTVKEAWKRADMMKKRSEIMRVEIAEYTGWDIAANITSVPVTALDDIILDGKKWVPEFYQQIMQHSNLSGVTLPASTNSFSQAISSPRNSLLIAESQQQEVAQFQENKLAYHWLSAIGCYLSCAFVGTLCMSFWGLQGLTISLVVNVLLWSFFGWRRIFTHPEDLLI